MKWSWNIGYCYPILWKIDDSDIKLPQIWSLFIKESKYDSYLIDYNIIYSENTRLVFLVFLKIPLSILG